MWRGGEGERKRRVRVDREGGGGAHGPSRAGLGGVQRGASSCSSAHRDEVIPFLMPRWRAGGRGRAGPPPGVRVFEGGTGAAASRETRGPRESPTLSRRVAKRPPPRAPQVHLVRSAWPLLHPLSPRRLTRNDRGSSGRALTASLTAASTLAASSVFSMYSETDMMACVRVRECAGCAWENARRGRCVRRRAV